MKINFRIIFFLFFIFLFVLTFLFIKRNKKPIFYLEENLLVDTVNKIILFEGTIIKNRGEVKFLINPKGYEWLNEKVGILGNISLINLQNALAFLNWALWESLYIYKNLSRKISLFIITNDKEIAAESLIVSKENQLTFLNLIFLGDPYWDNIVLKENYSNCQKCPLLEEEIKYFDKIFPQRYFLNTKYFPIDKRVKIKLILSDYNK
ncbi:MAG: hypothetical protein N2323_01985 [candidate division WOR-3 bacterium]|nr:hypothetical protein [candidate division WOR-3 bacterium]MCX7836717.1 hypothetical protein [candidate division WOR-3 bacterium]MDW8113446.1 hypothetical protein [candidate division WOR-3 bacterium]